LEVSINMPMMLNTCAKLKLNMKDLCQKDHAHGQIDGGPVQVERIPGGHYKPYD
jgi:hypothetical protein